MTRRLDETKGGNRGRAIDSEKVNCSREGRTRLVKDEASRDRFARACPLWST